MRRALAVVAVLSAGVAVAGTFSGGFTFGDGGGLAGIGIGDGTTTIAGVSVPAMSFDLQAGVTTPNDLPDSLTVNSVAMTLVLACDAQGISGTTWTCRDANGSVVLTEAGTGSSPTSSALTPFKALDSNERGAFYVFGGKRHDAPSSSVGDLGTDDITIEFVGKLGATSGAAIVDKDIVGTDGWSLGMSGTAAVALSLRTASTTTAVGSGTVGALTWGHHIFFVDRNEASTNGAFGYGNGNAGSGANLSARSTSVSNASTLALSASVGGAARNNTITSIRIWKCSGCFAGGATNPAQWAPIARQRAAVALGVSPSIAVGTAAPTALVRATAAHVDVVDGNTRQLYIVGSNAPRVARRTSGGTLVSGYMSEPAATNLALQSQTLGTTWTAITVGDNVLADQWAGADLTTTGDDIDGNNSLGEHGLRQSITVSATTHTFSAWADPGVQTFAVLRNNTVASGAAWFDLATCVSASCTIGQDCPAAVKTTQVGVSQATASRWPIDTTGDGVADITLCRVSIAYTGTAAAHDHDLLCAPSDGVLTYTDADATADCGFWGVRVEALPMATSYIATTTAAVARNADDVRFDGASHYTGDPSTMAVDVLCRPHDSSTVTFASVGTGTTNYARLGIDATADRPFAEATVTTQQWSIVGASGDVSDGTSHKLRQTMATNSIEGWYDGASMGTDTLATLPTAAGSSIFFGSAGGTAGAAACLISRFRLWPSIVTPAVVP